MKIVYSKLKRIISLNTNRENGWFIESNRKDGTFLILRVLISPNANGGKFETASRINVILETTNSITESFFKSMENTDLSRDSKELLCDKLREILVDNGVDL